MAKHTKHTKGPWNVKHSNSKSAFNIVATIPGEIYKIAVCPYPGDKDLSINFIENEKSQVNANAKLMSFAPEMLEALQWFVDRCDKGEVRSTTTYNRFKELIEKATE